MATAEVLQLPTLADLSSHCDLLSVVLFQLSAEDILFLAQASKKICTNVKSALRYAHVSANELVRSSTVTPTVELWIAELEVAIGFANDVAALYTGSPYTESDEDEFCEITKAYGCKLVHFKLNPAGEIDGAYVLSDNRFIFHFHWCEHCYACVIQSKDKSLHHDARFFEDVVDIIHFNSSLSLEFHQFVVSRGNNNRFDGREIASIKLSEAMTLNDLANAVRDVDPIHRLFELCGHSSGLSISLKPMMYKIFFSTFAPRVFETPAALIDTDLGSFNIWVFLADIVRISEYMDAAANCDFRACSTATWAGVQHILNAAAVACGFTVTDFTMTPPELGEHHFEIEFNYRLTLGLRMGKEPYHVKSGILCPISRDGNRIYGNTFAFQLDHSECEWIHGDYTHLYEMYKRSLQSCS
jgi:hypothetical protein